MSWSEIDKHGAAIDQFWHNYLSVLEKISIPKKSRKYYRIYAEMYIASLT